MTASLSDGSPSLFSKRIRFPLNSQIRLSTKECPILLQSQKEKTLIPHPSSNGFRTRIYFEVTQHQEFITSFWNVGENGHSNKTAKGLQYQKQQLPLPSHRMETWSGHSFAAPHRDLIESGHSQLGMLNNSGSASVWLILMSFLEIK